MRKERCLVPKREIQLILVINYYFKEIHLFLIWHIRIVACYIFTRICVIQEKQNLM